MATTLISWRPSALPGACPSFTSAAQPLTMTNRALGLPAVAGINGAYVPAGVLPGRVQPSIVHNSIGTPAGVKRPATAANAAQGATTSELVELAAGLFRSQRDAAADTVTGMVKGIDARGIPPRGRRLV